MKKILLYTLMTVAAAGMTACEDFLTRDTYDQIGSDEVWKSETDLELYANGFIQKMIPGDGTITRGDIDADYCAVDIATDLLRPDGNVSPDNQGGWTESSWTNLRRVNYMLDNMHRCRGRVSDEVYNHYEGVARFWRAWFYYDKVRTFGAVPWYDFTISASDKEALTKPRDSREYVMDKVLEDLTFASTYCLADAKYTKGSALINKWVALAFKSRVCLYEGTFRKYHGIADETIDGVTISADYFLQLAADAAWAVMEQNKYSLYKGNTLKLDAPYREYFILEDGDAKETILSMRFNADILVRHGIQFTFRNMRHSATQRLVNHYLMADGSKIQDQPGYETMTYNQQFQNRDPRMAQTLMAPGYVDLNGIDEVIEDCKSYDMTGYRFIKFVSDDTHNGATTSTTDWPVFRYPEILLTYAEAKAELGTLTPEDIALTVDVVRDRVGMPALDMTAANNNPDPLMASYYPNVNSGANKGVILEIRRERTVELPCEGLRQWDMLRWKEGAQLVPSSNGLDGFLGCYFPSLGEYDMNGDGKMDLCLWSGTKPATTCDAMLEIGEGKDAQLTEGTSGYIVCFRGRTYKWEEGRDYLWPIPTDQRVATGGALSQNPGYEDGLSF